MKVLETVKYDYEVIRRLEMVKIDKKGTKDGKV